MARPERILNISSPIAQERLIPRLNVPIRFHAIDSIDSLARKTDAQVMGGQLLSLFDRGDTIIDLDKIVPTALNLFDDNTLLEDSLTKLHLGGQIEAVDVCNLQLGTFALHLLYRVKTNEGVKHFVSYVSRFPKDIKAIHADMVRIGDIAESDFQNLQFLHDRMTHQNKQVKAKYGVVQPLAFGTSHQFGKEFGIYTTAFEEKGELHVANNPLIGEMRGHHIEVTAAVPIYHYAIPLDKIMVRENELITINADTIKKKLSLSRDAKKLNHMPEFQQLLKQQKEVILANAVLFLIGERNFPGSLTLNAGDWMVLFDNKQIKHMTFVTTRGLMSKLSDEEWIDYMFKLRELDKFATPQSYFKPFGQFSRADIATILQDAKRMTGIT